MNAVIGDLVTVNTHRNIQRSLLKPKGILETYRIVVVRTNQL
jgi:hypothetical protein